jgi:hypothetical protein
MKILGCMLETLDWKLDRFITQVTNKFKNWKWYNLEYTSSQTL